jgi:uncharacterized RDD family membrane protein YckC
MDMPTKAGWYDDPENDHQLRYFDGVVWSKHTTPRSTRVNSAAAQPGQQEYPGQGHAPQYPGQVQAQAPQQAPGHAAPTAPGAGAPPAGPPATAPGAPPATPPGPPQQGGWQQPGQPQPGQQYPGQNQQFPGTPQQGGWNAAAHPGWQPLPTTPDGQPLASYGRRAGAFAIDFVVTSVLGGLLSAPVQLSSSGELQKAVDDFVAGGTFTSFLDAVMNMSEQNVVPLTLIGLATSFLYHVIFVALLSATPGKLLLGISVRRREAPGRVGWSIAVRRRLLQTVLGLLPLVPVLQLAYLLGSAVDLSWPLWDAKKQALHDKIAGTNVVVGRQPPR